MLLLSVVDADDEVDVDVNFWKDDMPLGVIARQANFVISDGKEDFWVSSLKCLEGSDVLAGFWLILGKHLEL